MNSENSRFNLADKIGFKKSGNYVLLPNLSV